MPPKKRKRAEATEAAAAGRGHFPGLPTCGACHDSGQLTVPYVERRPFGTLPSYALIPGYARNEEKDPPALLSAMRSMPKNALRICRPEDCHLQAGDIVPKRVQAKAR
jgi:hypothetical protein|tara:strand:+ start:626 stop:949 length:324 start_codon:yes stop_codon:yes gene_type:complete